MGLDVSIFDNNEQRLATKRIGNVAHVARLRDLAAARLGSKSLVVSKMLYDGNHSGDSLPVADLGQLATELLVLEEASEQEMQAFAREMLGIVRIARQHERPVCFT
ncbi:MAG TPA: hypothetical protein VFE51_14355 [Verrucomicrobiae bacterium]|nr:hypothetical protein [Verrucomicrobiae bacterium]